MSCDVMDCMAPAAWVECNSCGTRAQLCAQHVEVFICQCGLVDWLPAGPAPAPAPGDGWPAPQPAAPAAAPTGWPPPPLPPLVGVPQQMVASRHQQNTLAPPPNRLRVLCFNLQNFTGDQRMGRTNGAIGSPANQLRAEIVARLIQHWGIDLFLAMETGSDVSAAMASIGRHLGGSHEPLVSAHTHDTPQPRASHEIAVDHPWVRDVLRLRLLSEQFHLLCAGPRDWSEPGVIRMLEELHACPGAAAFLAEDWALRAPIRATRHVIGQQLLSAVAIPGLECAVPGRADQVGPWMQAMDLLRDEARLVRFDVRPPSGVDPDQRLRRLLCWIDILEVKGLGRFLRDNPGGGGTIVGQLARRLGADMNAACALLLFAHRRIRLDRRAEFQDENEDADLYYEALRHFRCVDFHFETYGALIRCTPEQRGAMMGLRGNWSILRLGEDGSLLATQQPGSSFNWRSAWRAFVPLLGGRWVEVLLFHTRFTPSAEALADRDDETVHDRTLRMRAESIVSVAETVNGQTGAPIVMLGDFNLPMTEGRPVLAGFSDHMAGLGFRRTPGDHPLSTLRSPGSIAQAGADFYSEAYDGAYLQGIPEGHSDALIPRVDAIAAVLGPALCDRLRPFVAAYYRRKMAKLLERLRVVRRMLIDKPTRGAAEAVLLSILGDVRTEPRFAGGALPLLLCQNDAGFGALEAALGARCGAFEGRPMDVSLSAADLDRDPMAGLIRDLGVIETHGRWGALDPARQARFREFAAVLREARVAFDNIDGQASVRLAIGYALVVSDHLPLFLQFDLDRPL
ncbi:MAG: hypothetical protein KBF78_05740 [Fuscovulum sp.]|nr:hypothetical protein [Fuscovulum sp.]